MNTAALNINCWLESFVAWLHKPSKAKAVAKPAPAEKPKERVRIAGLR